MPLVPMLRRQRQVALELRGQPDLHNEFLDSQSFKRKPGKGVVGITNRTKAITFMIYMKVMAF